MRNQTHLMIQYIISLITSLVVGIAGLLLGSNIGGNYGFPSFGHVVGWEAGGVFFGMLGIVVGAWLGVMLAAKLTHTPGQFLRVAAFVAPTLIVDLLIYDYYMHPVTLTLLILLPTTVAVLAMNGLKQTVANV